MGKSIDQSSPGPDSRLIAADMDGRNDPLIREAVLSRTTVVMTLAVLGARTGSSGFCHVRGKLISMDDQGVWVEIETDAAEAVRGQIASGEQVGLSMRLRGTKYVTAVRATKYNGTYVSRGTTRAVPAMLIAWPMSLKQVQRRASQRVAVSPAHGVSVQIKRAAGKPELTGYCTLCDIAPGGIAVSILGAQDMQIDERLAVVITHGDRHGRFEGRTRHLRPTDSTDTLIAGIQLTVPATVDGAADIYWLLGLIKMLQQSPPASADAPPAIKPTISADAVPSAA